MTRLRRPPLSRVRSLPFFSPSFFQFKKFSSLLRLVLTWFSCRCDGKAPTVETSRPPIYLEYTGGGPFAAGPF